MSKMKKELFFGKIAVLSFDDYLKWGNKEMHDALLKEVRQEIERMEEMVKSIDAYIHQCEIWRQQIESDSEDRNMYESCIRHHHIRCCWHFECRSELKLYGESFDLRRYLVLLACAPISETYREDCEKFWAFTKNNREGFLPEEIATYISDIRNYIYLPMLDQEGVPAEACDYYFDLLLELEKRI